MQLADLDISLSGCSKDFFNHVQVAISVSGSLENIDRFNTLHGNPTPDLGIVAISSTHRLNKQKTAITPGYQCHCISISEAHQSARTSQCNPICIHCSAEISPAPRRAEPTRSLRVQPCRRPRQETDCAHTPARLDQIRNRDQDRDRWIPGSGITYITARTDLAN